MLHLNKRLKWPKKWQIWQKCSFGAEFNRDPKIFGQIFSQTRNPCAKTRYSSAQKAYVLTWRITWCGHWRRVTDAIYAWEHGLKEQQGLLNKRTAVSTLSAPIEWARPFFMGLTLSVSFSYSFSLPLLLPLPFSFFSFLFLSFFYFHFCRRRNKFRRRL